MMKSRLIAGLGLSLTIFGTSAAFASPGEIVLPEIYTETKAVSTTDIIGIVQSPDKPWAVVKVTPDFLSGDLKYGIGGQNPTCTASGTFKVIGSMGSAIPKNTGAYCWLITDWALDQRGVAMREIKSPFQYGGPKPSEHSCICELNEDKTGEGMVSDIRLVPKGWEQFPPEAVTFLRSHQALLVPQASSEPQLRVLLTNRNPYLVLTAAKLLRAQHAFTSSDMGTVLSSHDSKLIAVVVATCAIDEWWKQDKPIVQFLQDQTPKIGSLDQLEGVSVGFVAAQDMLYTPDVFGLQSPAVVPKLVSLNKLDTDGASVPQEMKKIRQRLDALDPLGSDANHTWAAIDNMCREVGQ